jgi:hypothetical protein
MVGTLGESDQLRHLHFGCSRCRSELAGAWLRAGDVELSPNAVEVEARRLEAMARCSCRDPHDVKHVAPKRKLGALNSPGSIELADRRGVDRYEHPGPIRSHQACYGAHAGRIEAAAQDGSARPHLCLGRGLGSDAQWADGTVRDPKELHEIDRRARAHTHGELASTVSVEVGGGERFADAAAGARPMTTPQHLVEVPARAEADAKVNPARGRKVRTALPGREGSDERRNIGGPVAVEIARRPRADAARGAR